MSASIREIRAAAAAFLYAVTLALILSLAFPLPEEWMPRALARALAPFAFFFARAIETGAIGADEGGGHG